ncbi:MAG: GH25 family lysozyme, partial [Lachnospiraceae bacterium]|nr:GH25 family lysozyme [Lachnospiraceae bacterium]
MKKRRVWALLLSFGMMISLLGGCVSRAKVTEDMIPTVTDLRQGGGEETESGIISLAMNRSYVSELTRLDGDNTEMAAVDEKQIPVVLKATSVDKDLKVKIVNQKNDRVITGTRFEVTVTDSAKKTKTYTDDDKDGIIYIKSMEPGKCRISMKSAGSYSAPADISAEVKANIEYKVVDITDEIKKESEINVAKEDSNSNGNAGAGNAVTLKDTVEFVASSRTEITEEVKTQKKDSFGQLMYEKQQTDKYGTPVYAKILSEPASEHVDNNGDNKCDRCGASMTAAHTHDYVKITVQEPTCTENGTWEEKCSCGAVNGVTGELDALGHTDSDGDGKCDRCGADMTSEMQQPEEQTVASAIKRMGIRLLTAAPTDRIVYDTSSAPVYEITKQVTGYKYTGWQTIDGATYYFDKNGKKVTGTQVIQGIQYTFSSEGVRSGTIGIDVSKFQPSINWKKVKNAGINFVMIRCGYRGYGSGVLVEDPMFASHITGAKAAGLRVGVYFFSQAITEAEAVEEASMAVKLANRYGINMPIAIDSEYANGGAGRADRLSKSERTRITIAFCNTVANSGHTPMVYASKAWFSDHLNVSQFPGSYRIWVAHYAEKCGYTGRYDMWQNTSKG